jgi:hypothetical protein
MNPPELKQIALDIRLDDEACFDLRLEFGIACVLRVEHLLTETDIIDALSTGKRFLAGECAKNELSEAAANAAKAARSHAGSNSLDGAGSAAVSTSHGVAAALAGRALEAAEYAAYASVYSYASYAVTDLDAYTDEHNWQITKLRELVKSNE